MIGTLITSQIGCAEKVAKISGPIDRIKFSQDYKYKIHLKNGEQIGDVTADQVQKDKNYLILQTQSGEKKLMNQDVKKIEALAKASKGNNAARGFGLGLGTGAILGLLFGLAVSPGGDCQDGCVDITGISFLMGGIAGGLLGLGIGAATPKHEKIEITPIVSPVPGGVNAGANLGVTF